MNRGGDVKPVSEMTAEEVEERVKSILDKMANNLSKRVFHPCSKECEGDHISIAQLAMECGEKYGPFEGIKSSETGK